MVNAGRSVADLKPGERGTISSFTDEEMSVKLLEMGCLPGNEVRMCCRAPFGGPVCISVCGYHLSLRLDEAKNVKLR